MKPRGTHKSNIILPGACFLCELRLIETGESEGDRLPVASLAEHVPQLSPFFCITCTLKDLP